MRVLSRSAILVDLMTEKRDVATVAAYAANLGYRVEIRRPEGSEGGDWPAALIVRDEEIWAQDDIAHQIILLAVAGGVTPVEALDLVRQRMDAVGVDLEAPVPVFDRPADSCADE